MPILVKPTIACNFRCDYCYQTALREGGCGGYDLDAVEAAMRREFKSKGSITLHGGEITTLPLADFRRLLKIAYELSGSTSIQTNAYEITDAHIETFREFKTSVGISIDGPWPLNRYRGGGANREEKTATVLRNMECLRRAGLSVSVISVISHLHVENPELYWQWVQSLKGMGIVSGRMNYIQRIEGFEGTDLPEARFAEFYVEMAKRVCEEPALQWQPFRDVVDNLLGLGLGTCTFTRCDPYNTASAIVIDGQGVLHSCLRNTQDGTALLRADTGNIRYECLKQTPQSHGGCKDCRWWKVCFGSCPAVALDGDWRNRGAYCEVWKALYDFAERRLKGLMPNIRLVTEDEAEEYEERKQGIGERTFAAMAKPGGSSWRQTARGPTKTQCQKPGTWEKVSGTYSDVGGYLKDLGGGYKHADHSDGSGTK